MKQNTMIHRSTRAAIKLLLAALLPATAQSAWAWQGLGSQESPYQISSIEDLDQLATYVNSGTGDDYAASGYDGKYFVLTNDLNYSHKADGEVGASTENNYTAIGCNGHSFLGHFDGQGHTVSGIRIYKSGGTEADWYQGLFGYILGAEVKNVTLADARITGYHSTGGIVGRIERGTVTNCHVLSDVTIGAEKGSASYHGGIVGQNSGGTVSGCTSAASITTSSGDSFGGVVGFNGGTVRDCLYLGTTVEGDNSVGAIVGYNTSNIATVQNCYYTSTTFQGKDNSGNNLANADCAVGSNNGGTFAKCGLARTVAAGMGVTIDAIALTGTATDYRVITGMTGDNIITAYSGGGIEYAGNRYYGNGCTVSLTLSTTIAPGTPGYNFYSDYVASSGTLSGAGSSYTLTMADADATISAAELIDWATESSGDSWDNAYMIYNKHQLDLLADRVNSGTTYEGKYFVLTNDIEYSHKADGEEGASTETNYTAIGCAGHPFMGYFDGKGHTVSGIRIYKNGSPDADQHQGLFGYIYVSAEVKNVTLADARITGYERTAGIVGYNSGTVTNCHVLSTVTIHAVAYDTKWHGGIVGYNTSTVSGCTSAASITTTASDCLDFGGVVGRNKGTVCDCLYLGNTVGGNKYVGAIVGNNGGDGTVENCYFTSTAITGKDGSGGTIANADCAVGRNTGTVAATVGLARTVAAGTGVTIDAIALTGNATDYRDITGMTGDNIITAYSGGGIEYAGNRYYGNGCTVSLTLNNAGEAPAGYMFAGAYTASAGTLSSNATDGYTLAMPDADATISAVIAPDPDHFSVSGDEYTIKTPAGWGVFCDALQDNTTYNRFSGKTVKLGNNIGTAQAPITRMAGGQYHDFCGTFDGQGHTLTFNISSDDITDGSTQYVAPFRFVSNTKADPSDEADSPAAFRNLHVTGTITTDKQFTGGLIGGCWGTVSIENCRVSVTIQSTISGDGTHGGIVGIQQNGALTITGCLFDGSLLGSATYAVGGFLGWRKSGAEIRNSLFAPAEVTVMNTSGATFARNKVDTYNSYYTYYLCDGTNYVPALADGTVSPANWYNGKALHTVTAGTDVTISTIALTGDATQYTVSGITAYSGGGLQLGENLYYGSGDAVSLTLSNTGAPAGYHNTGYTASAGTLSGSTLAMPDEDVTISNVLRSTGSALHFTYVDEKGDTQPIDAIALDGTETADGNGDIVLGAHAYYVGTDINYTNHIEFTNASGTILFLGDGATMTVNYGNYDAIHTVNYLTICGQTLGTGKLNATSTKGGAAGIRVRTGNLTINGGTFTATNGNGNGIHVENGNLITNGGTVTANGGGFGISVYNGNVTINGGNVTATGRNCGILDNDGNVTINGGNVTANGGSYGILASNVKLGWTNASDHIYAYSYGIASGGTLSVKEGQALVDEDGNILSGELTGSAISCKHLYPYIETLDLAANQAPDQNYWTTFYCGHTDYRIDANENACAYTATYADGKLTLHRLGKEVPKATAVIIVADNNEVSMYADFLNAFTGSNDLRGVDVDTPVDDIRSDLGNGTLYVLGMTTVNNEPHFGFHRYTATEMPARKAFVLVPAAPGSNANALTRGISIEFGDDATGIEAVEVLGNPSNQGRANDDSWYTINGVKLNGKPSKSGLYIYKGRKVAIK